MPTHDRLTRPALPRRLLPVIAVVLSMGILTACGPKPEAGVYDPLEPTNRAIHDFNKSLDRAAVRPTANAYGVVVPGPIRQGIQNFALNLGQPGNVANNLLQARLDDAVVNTMRFAVNSTVGIGGLFDPATAIGIPDLRTDFGETLAVWGVREGPFLELPFAGPSTLRDTAGIVVDVVYDPLRYILPTAEANAATGIQVAAGLGRRYRFSKTIDSILYESADSYAQSRLLYLDSRRFELGQKTEGEGDFVDPYEDPYGE
jgi:phospholipid-binding lipoprotein MlaA